MSGRVTDYARAITQGPDYHWFGYYDKLQFDTAGLRVLGMRVRFHGRQPRPDDTIEVGVIDLDGGAWTGLGDTRAWCWQQGCMLQWIPSTNDLVLWNDRQGDDYICHILDPGSGEKKTLPSPIYTLSPNGRVGITPDFRRINDMRPGYGYAGPADPDREELAPERSGIWRVDMATGKRELIVTLASIAAIPFPGGDLSEAKHYFNHLLVNPDGSRFLFLHRWRFGDGPFHTRMMTAALDGSEVRTVDASGHSSHFIWRDPHHILVFTNPPGRGWGFYLFDERSATAETAIDDPRNGHCTYLSGNQWILNDTYPQEPDRSQQLYLYHVETGRRVDLGSYTAAQSYDGEWRCDLHPRSSRDGKMVTMDSTHGEDGRQMYLIDLDHVPGG